MIRLHVDARAGADASRPSATLRATSASPLAAGSGGILALARGRSFGALTGRRRSACRRRLIVVLDALGIRAAVALELRLDPIDCRSIAIRALTPIAELRQPFDRGLVFFQVESIDHLLDRVVVGRHCRGLGLRLGRRRLCARGRNRARDETVRESDENPTVHQTSSG